MAGSSSLSSCLKSYLQLRLQVLNSYFCLLQMKCTRRYFLGGRTRFSGSFSRSWADLLQTVSHTVSIFKYAYTNAQLLLIYNLVLLSMVSDDEASTQLNFQGGLCSSTEAEPFLEDYSLEVIYPITLKLIAMSIMAFLVSIVIDIMLYNADSIHTGKVETSYLAGLKTFKESAMGSEIANNMMFVDFAREVFRLNVVAQTGSNQTTTCNQTRYVCNSSNADLWKLAENYYQLIILNYNNLIRSISTFEDAEVFIHWGDASNSILQYQLSSPTYKITPILASYVSLYTGSGYYFEVIKKFNSDQSTDYDMKLLICSKLVNVNQAARFCIVTPGDLESQVLSKQNPIRITNNDILSIFPNQTIARNTGARSSSQIQQSLRGNDFGLYEKNHAEFYSAFHLSDCISVFKKSKSFTLNQIMVCNPPQLRYFLARIVIFVEGVISIPARYYVEELASRAKLNNFKLQFFVFSNQTFYVQETQKTKSINFKQSLQGILIVVLTILWIILMPIVPLRFVGRELAESVTLLIKMCKTVKNIRNKDDLDQQIDTFNKLNIQISRSNNIFLPTIECFKYFIWYRKWQFAVKNSKRKLLLEEGLTLFGSADFAPVLMYIFEKQIQREVKIAENYKRMRKIFAQKFIAYENQYKIENNININKPRTAARKVKKSGFNTEQSLADNDNVYSKDSCVFEQDYSNMENRIGKQLELLELQKKSKRYVRFSNDLHQDQKPIQYRVSKFLLNLPSQSSIVKSSQKSIEEEIKKKEEEEMASNPVESSKDDRIDIKDQQIQLNSKNDEDWSMYFKFDQLNESSSLDLYDEECLDLKRFSLKKLDEKLGESYECLFRTYEKMIIIKKIYLEKQEESEVHEYINQLYTMLIEKLRFTYKYVKHKNKQREKMLKQLNRKLISIKKERKIFNNFETSQQDKLHSSQKKLHETISVIEDELDQESKLIDIQFKEFITIEEKYQVDSNLLERAKLYQTKILKILSYPIQYKKLEKLCQSKNEDIRVEARVIMAEEFFCISPHADLEVLIKAQQNLSQNHTTHSQKQKTLKLIKQVLRNRDFMKRDEAEIELIKNYYNYAHKKIYFVADLSDNYEIFRPVIDEIYKNMGQVDMFQIMNLAMNEVLQDMIINGSEIKPSKLSEFEAKFEHLHNEANRIKSVVSTKTGNRKIAFEKDFNVIIQKIEKESINLSKFIVLILGGQNESQSKTHEDFESSSAQNRQIYQKVHQQILSKIEQNYFHVILVGYNLKDYQTRQGKLKKYVRHAHDLMEIDISKPNYTMLFKELNKFMNR